MNTSHTPAPGTRALMSGLSTDSANQIRLKHNQTSLESSGHVQALPMTSKGLSDMHQAITAQVQRLGQSNTQQSILDTARSPAMAALIAKGAPGTEAMVKVLINRVAAAYTAIRKDVAAAAQSMQDTSPAKTLKSIGMQTNNTMRQALAQHRELRERLRDQQNDAPMAG